jgi:D-alanyl-D-alanine carboxypeptidase
MRSRRALALLAAAPLALAACGGAGDDGAAPVVPQQPAADRPAAEQPPAQAGPPRTIVLVRRRGGVPDRWVARLRRHDAVDALTLTWRTQRLLRRTDRSDGRAAVAGPAGYAVPLDALVVQPRAYARVTGAAAAGELRSGRALLSETSARVRRARAGDRLVLTDGRSPRVATVVPDDVARESELVLAAADVPAHERRNGQVLLATTDPEAVARAVPEDRLTRVGIVDAGPRGDDRGRERGGIVRSVELKRRFGEFSVRLPYGEDWITIDPAWVDREIVSRRVPLLGTVTCNRAMIAPLRRVLASLERRGLGHLVDAGDYAGCHAPRRIPGSGSLSLHAWGLAVDINASANPPGPESRQDPRLVRAFERAGFTWGGRWPTAPDPMHFELQAPPPRA